MSPEPKIERYEVITPESITPDNYENIVVKTTTGTEVKVNKKHAHLHQLFYDACEQRRALKIGYATYMNKEYVHTAEYFDGKPPVEKQTAPVKTDAGPLPKQASQPSREDNIELNGWMNRITDLIISGQLSAVFGKKNVPAIMEWYRARYYGSTKAAFDGSKFPVYKVEE